MSLPLKTFLITGANRGIGLEIVRQIVASPSGPEVVMATCRDLAKAPKLMDIAKADPRVKVIKLEMTSDADIDAAFKEADKLVGPRGLNYLFNNAGLFEGGLDADAGIFNCNRAGLQRHYDVNVSGQLVLTQRLLPLIQRAAKLKSTKDPNCQAGIGMVASDFGSQGLTYKNVLFNSLQYKCSKTAVTMSSIILSHELAPEGIHCFAMHPGWVSTDMGGQAADITPQQSAKGLLNVIAGLSKDNNGKLVMYDGSIMPY